MSDARAVRALRGATTVPEDTAAAVEGAVVELLGEMFERNGIAHDDLISILFTATDELHSTFPATAARTFGLGDVPLICARELNIHGSVERCVRVMMHLTTSRSRAQLRHVYLREAASLRDDLPA